MLGETLIAVVRMTVQLLLVGLYLQVVFDLNSFWLNGLWLLVMIGVAGVRGLELCVGCGGGTRHDSAATTEDATSDLELGHDGADGHACSHVQKFSG